MGTKLRPPAVPLVTVDPYFSVWSMANRLTDDHTRHWTGTANGMVGLIRIDGRPYRFMGRLDPGGNPSCEPPAMEQVQLQVAPLSTTYSFAAGGVALDVDFTTPLLLDDLDLLSRPASYITLAVRATDGREHAVSLYLDVTAEWCTNTPDQPVTWGRRSLPGGAQVLSMGTAEQPVLKRRGDDVRIDWGYMHLAVPALPGATLHTVLMPARERRAWAEEGKLPATDDAATPRPPVEDMPVMACELGLGKVGPAGWSGYLVLAYDDILSVEYFHRQLPAYWRRNGQTFDAMLAAAIEEYPRVLKRCAAFGEALQRDALAAGGEQYADILTLAYRQAIAAHKLVQGEDGELLFFSKECFSNGCMATVDVSYPSIPLFLLYQPELVLGMMRPILRYAAMPDWPHDFAPHDVGRFPQANGQVYGDNLLEWQMPVEECGNMLLMAAAACRAKGDAGFAAEHWALLTRWANYLRAYGFDPGNQLCTDDFAGHLAHNANLSIKAIEALGAYGQLCSMLGRTDEADEWLREARRLAAAWLEAAAEGDHTRLAFDQPGTWSLKYNLAWDTILGLDLFPAEIAAREVAHYLRMRKRYGTPLDSRKDYTKNDWLVWAGSLARSRDDFAGLIAPLWDYLNESRSRVPLNDWYDTVAGLQIWFQHRSVVGGLFMQLLKHRGFRVEA